MAAQRKTSQQSPDRPSKATRRADPVIGSKKIYDFAQALHKASGGPTPALKQAYAAYLQNEGSANKD